MLFGVSQQIHKSSRSVRNLRNALSLQHRCAYSPYPPHRVFNYSRKHFISREENSYIFRQCSNTPSSRRGSDSAVPRRDKVADLEFALAPMQIFHASAVLHTSRKIMIQFYSFQLSTKFIEYIFEFIIIYIKDGCKKMFVETYIII